MFIKSGYESFMSLDDPSLVLQELNDSIAATYKSSEMLFTASCVDIHTDTGEIALACAGHPPGCAIRGGEIVLLEGDGAPMGVRKGMKYDKVTTTLAKGDGLYLHTDGINEAHVEGGDYFGEERLYESIRRAHVANEDVAAKLRAELFDFVGPFLLSDDASLIGVRLE
jgi:sigma-B regulation protein RsbU (phosphoserine phosphatase)